MPTRPGKYELVCAELCGWGHYKMRGQVTVHETEAELQEWIDEMLEEQDRASSPWLPHPRGGEWDEC